MFPPSTFILFNISVNNFGLTIDTNINLLIIIREIAYDFESDRYPFMAKHAALKNYVNHTQAYGTTNDVYLDSHSNLKEVLSHYGVNLGTNKVLRKYMMRKKGYNPTNSTMISNTTIMKEYNAAAKEAYEAVTFLSGLNSSRYQELIDDLVNSYLNGSDEYPKTVVEVYKLINS